jgi:hypothetical protein
MAAAPFRQIGQTAALRIADEYTGHKTKASPALVGWSGSRWFRAKRPELCRASRIR